MKDFDFEKSLNFIKKKCERYDSHKNRLFEKAWNDFDKIVTMIISKYNPTFIYQWGSLLNKRHFSEISDIDIAIEGISCAELYFKMIGESAELTDFPLDIVEIEKINPIHAQSIKNKGRLVYEKK